MRRLVLLLGMLAVTQGAFAEEASASKKAGESVKKGAEATERGLKKGGEATVNGLKKAGDWLDRQFKKGSKKVEKVGK